MTCLLTLGVLLDTVCTKRIYNELQVVQRADGEEEDDDERDPNNRLFTWIGKVEKELELLLLGKEEKFKMKRRTKKEVEQAMAIKKLEQHSFQDD